MFAVFVMPECFRSDITDATLAIVHILVSRPSSPSPVTRIKRKGMVTRQQLLQIDRQNVKDEQEADDQALGERESKCFASHFHLLHLEPEFK